MRPVLIIVALLAVLAGCGDDPATDEPQTESAELVAYSRTGGFAPVTETLTVQREGDAVLESGFEGSGSERVAFTLDASELEDLTAAVEAAPLDEVEPGPGGCADCYVYSIEIDGAKIELSDADLYEGSEAVVPNEVFALLDELGRIVENHAPAAD
jgi:hypothetical protein